MKRVLLCMVLFAGCIHGQRVENFPPAQRPGGLDVEVTTSAEAPRITGELLAVRADGLLIGTQSRIVFVSFGTIRDGRFPAVARLRIGARRTPGPDKLKELSLMSRFPQGLHSDLLERLLEAYSQDVVEEIR